MSFDKDYKPGTMLFNPYNGKPRDDRDISSDPKGLLIVDTKAPMFAAKPRITLEEVREAVARGWCSDANQHKEMDEDLASSCADEVLSLIQNHRPKTTQWNAEHEKLETVLRLTVEEVMYRSGAATLRVPIKLYGVQFWIKVEAANEHLSGD